jgi:hypothetical protein
VSEIIGDNSQERNKVYPRPNFTFIPNEFLDEVMPQITNEAELKVTFAFIRHAYGRGKPAGELTFRQLSELTGMSIEEVKEGCDLAIQRGYVERNLL